VGPEVTTPKAADWGDVVGASTTAPGQAGGKPRAFLWHKGHMSDLNALIAAKLVHVSNHRLQHQRAGAGLLREMFREFESSPMILKSGSPKIPQSNSSTHPNFVHSSLLINAIRKGRSIFSSPRPLMSRGLPPSSFFGFYGMYYPAFLRGEAYLAQHHGPATAAEFQKILDHRGVVISDLIGALAHLQQGRAFALSGDKVEAKVAYRVFLQLWKDAEPTPPQ
jgi:probable HAF family extracellular repeat protein